MAVLLLISTLLFPSAILRGAGNDSMTWARVDGVPLVRDEIELAMGKFRARIAHVRTLPVARESLQAIARDVLETAIAVKLQQIVAVRLGLLNDASYESFVTSWTEENARRSAAKQRGQVVYGPMSFSRAAFFDYSFTNLVQRMQDRLAADFNLLESRITTMYDSLKSDLFRKPPLFRWLEVSPLTMSDSAMTVLRTALQTNDDEERLMAAYPCRAQARMRGEEDGAGSSEEHDRVFAAVREMASGEIRDVRDDAGAAMLVKCVERREQGLMPLEQVRGVVVGRLRESEYRRYLDSVRQKTDVIIPDWTIDRFVSEQMGCGQ